MIGPIKGGFTGRVVEITTKEQADHLKGTRLYAPRHRLPPAGEDEFYYADLIGLTIRDTGGRELGRVKAMHNHGADDLIEMQPMDGGRTALIPFTKAIVPTVDIAQKTIIIDAPDELL